MVTLFEPLMLAILPSQYHNCGNRNSTTICLEVKGDALQDHTQPPRHHRHN